MKNIQKGFTLIELMVTIAIMAIMLAIAIPNLSEWVAKRRVAAAAEKVANMIRFGRAEAARLNSPVYLCPVQIRVDGTPNNQCRSYYVDDPSYKGGSGLMLWADSNLDKRYERAKDKSLKVSILNKADDPQIKYQMRSIKYDGSDADKGANASILAFFPDGSIRRITTQGANNPAFRESYPVGGYVKFTLTDGRTENKDIRARRAVVMLVSGSQVSFCDAADTREACKYKQ
jgi:hypothetical protein